MNHSLSIPSPHSFSRRPSVMQRVEVFSAAELAHFVHPVASQCGRTHHQGGQGAAVCSLSLGIFLSPE